MITLFQGADVFLLSPRARLAEQGAPERCGYNSLLIKTLDRNSEGPPRGGLQYVIPRMSLIGTSRHSPRRNILDAIGGIADIGRYSWSFRRFSDGSFLGASAAWDGTKHHGRSGKGGSYDNPSIQVSRGNRLGFGSS